MGRYWKLVILVTGIVVVLGTFFIQTTLANLALPEFDIKKVTGDLAEIDPVIINGYYEDRIVRSDMWITSKETVHLNERSFFERMNDLQFHSPLVQDLYKNNRSFLRGKNFYSGTFIENDEQIIYVSLPWDQTNDTAVQVEIAILDKQSKEETLFQLDIPNGEKYFYLYLEQVIVREDELHIAASVSSHFDDEEMHVYSIDLAKQTVTHDTLISDQDSYLQTYVDDDQPTFLVFEKNLYQEVEESHSEFVDKQLMYMDLATKEVVNLDLPFELDEDKIVHLENDTLYLLSLAEKQLMIEGFNLVTEEVLEKTIDMPLLSNVTINNYVMALSGQKVYLTRSNPNENRGAPITVIDFLTENMLFEGTIEPKQEIGNHYKLTFYNMNVRN
ncbi:hypothetical protein P4637_15755 [Halalkalibacterium halodurans]|uniref:hypothetical protein n=3 Tax=Halalkalibacterium halodurans TaxID=86665 RepID=UPI002E212C71|nr:hypothetical protein [Halalkalibacterium halodurans]MED4086265.1 hypothetical protein [Halalkalibacterium halodurans]MED4103390.1 hypothetical protein [Halalkalibacterium halodurans]MED4107913.1 hypothetical protein [Halalkalibacterium halodurans]MED4148216.1 hypothetical protein [Halalkalibacterium halodurans]